MEIGEILTYISQYGFSIVMCLLLWWTNKTTLESLKGMIQENTIAIKGLRDELSKK